MDDSFLKLNTLRLKAFNLSSSHFMTISYDWATNNYKISCRRCGNIGYSNNPVYYHLCHKCLYEGTFKAQYFLEYICRIKDYCDFCKHNFDTESLNIGILAYLIDDLCFVDGEKTVSPIVYCSFKCLTAVKKIKELEVLKEKYIDLEAKKTENDVLLGLRLQRLARLDYEIKRKAKEEEK